VPAGETYEQKVARGKQILRKERADDPNGNLGLTIHMDGEVYNVAQKSAMHHKLSQFDRFDE